MKRPIFGVLLTLLFLSFMFSTVSIHPAKASGTIYIRADGSVDPSTAPIQRGGDVYTLTDNITSDGDGIVVGRSNIVVDGAGCTVGGTGDGTGIDLSNRSNVTIKNVNTETFFYGIYLYNASDNSLSGNQMRANSYGIMITDSRANRVFGNSIMNNDWGIQLYFSPNNTLRDNNATNNKYGFAVYGGIIAAYIQDVDASNTVNGKPIYYWLNRQNLTVPLDTGYIALVNCTGMTLKNLNLTKNGQGALLAYTTDSTITENNATNNWEGIYLYHSSNNTISENGIIANNYGIILDDFCDDNTISKNNVTDARTSDSNNGIYLLNHSGHNIISENNVTGCLGYGISIWLSEYNIIYANKAKNDRDGIYVYESHNNLLTSNIVSGNTQFGISLWNSGNNNLTNNNLTGNWMDFATNAEYLSDFYQNIDSSNLVNGKPIYYLMDLENMVISANDYPDIGYMALVNGKSVVIENVGLQGVEGLVLAYSENCSVKNVNIENCTFAVWLLNSNNNTVSNVTVSNGYVGMLCLNSINNSMFENTISGNEYGIWSLNSHGNAFCHNSFLENSQQARCEQSSDIWDDGYPSGGNYWSDHNPPDVDKDKIGDLPYEINDNTDRYPLIYPFECYDAGYVCSPDLNEDEIVNIVDVSKVAKAFGCLPGDSNWNPVADMDLNEAINIVDVSKVAKQFGKEWK